MTKKFTEEQYQNIIGVDFGSMDEQKSKDVLYVALDTFDIKQETLNLARALTNPLTREWAHDKFVEKEKRYIWLLKDKRDFKLLRDSMDGSIMPDMFGWSPLRESEIKAWGYNPDMFDREEV